jgi:hypothetical protein
MATRPRRTVIIATLFLVLTAVGCDRKMGRLESGHPLGSTTVVEWEVLDGAAISVDLRFREDAPAYGCLVEAFDGSGASLGYVSARPKNQEERTLTMKLDEGASSAAVEDVRVTDCDI